MSKPDFEKMAGDALEAWFGLEWIEGQPEIMEMAEMLNSAFKAGLDHAGHIAHNHGWYSMGYVEDDPPANVITHNHACWAIRDAIRSEREKS